MAATSIEGALVRGRPAVVGCAGAGMLLSASRWACARPPTVMARAPTTSVAIAAMRMTAATLAMMTEGSVVSASARNSTAARAVTRSRRMRTLDGTPPPRRGRTLAG